MLKLVVLTAAVGLLPGIATAQGWSGYNSYGSPGQHSVQGHTNNNGTYVPPHMQTNPNSTMNDNWSTRGNTNPYTGRPGYVTPRY